MDKFKKGGPKRLQEPPHPSFAEIFPSKKSAHPTQTRTIPTVPVTNSPTNLKNPSTKKISPAYTQPKSRYQNRQPAQGKQAVRPHSPANDVSQGLSKNPRNEIPAKSYANVTQKSHHRTKENRTEVSHAPFSQASPIQNSSYRKTTRHKKMLYTTFSLLSVLTVALCATAWSFRNTLENGIGRANLQLGGINDGAVDILLVGLDSRTDAQGHPLSPRLLRRLHAEDNDPSLNTDTIILLRIPTNGRSATAISLPRDTYVSIPGIGKAKLNSAYGSTYEQTLENEIPKVIDRELAENDAKQAGRKALITTVENLTGVTIDHYAEIGLAGFAQLTDTLGGVKVCLNHRVYDPYSGANFHRGIQTLNGAQALSFVRQRHGLPHEDIDRIKRQQVFMAYIAHHIVSTDILTNPSRINQLITAVEDSIVIDKDWDVADLANRLSTLAAGQIKFATIPVEDTAAWSDDNTQSVVKVDPVAVKNWVTALVADPQKPQGKVPVDIFNIGSVDGLATNVSTVLQNKGYLEGIIGNSNQVHPATSIVLYNNKSDEAADIARILNIKAQADTSLPRDKVQVYLTDGYRGPGTPNYAMTHHNTSGSSNLPGPNAIVPHMIDAGNNGIHCVD